MNELQNFSFEHLQVRTVLIEKEPWFVAKDVADILEYSDTQAMTRRLDKEDIMTDKLSGMNMKSTLINESGLYEAIIGSKKKETKPFKRWITHEVLPTIRKHGAYMTSEVIEKTLTSPDFIIQLATQLKDEQQARLELEKENSQLNIELAEATERTRYLDLIFESKDDVLITQIAQDYGMGAPTFNKLLSSLRIQRKVNSQWILYSKYQAKGFIKSRTHSFTDKSGHVRTNITTTWTQKGREFLYRKLKTAGYLPVVEIEDVA
ncbi:MULTISPECIES: phage antirepressor [unclassified Lactococcus]|uniref:phage antirepressor n=1 Tax=unclassified Lactococcus TaxID=2643510 RepID=UPI0011C8EBF1|nr:MULTISPECIES: phage antirepressor [unclassified Lactococcus]MQW23919.1 phage antirepressor [Lactococcus sp. dk101]TXK37145.1 phage antirepressor [Lactococcus sp. dk310]TXK47999.1 phage antirepressor [Lactococcus sp. dk322]